MTNTQVIRPWSGIALTAVVVLIALTMVISEWQNPAVWAWAIFLVSITWLGLLRPKLVVGDEGLRVTNPLSTTTIGWHEVDSFDTQYTLSVLLTNGTKVVCWAAPAPGRHHARNVRRDEFRGVGIEHGNVVDGVIKAGESPRSISGQAIAVCRLRRQHFVRTGQTNGATYAHRLELLTAAVCAASLLAALLLS